MLTVQRGVISYIYKGMKMYSMALLFVAIAFQILRQKQYKVFFVSKQVVILRTTNGTNPYSHHLIDINISHIDRVCLLFTGSLFRSTTQQILQCLISLFISTCHTFGQ